MGSLGAMTAPFALIASTFTLAAAGMEGAALAVGACTLAYGVLRGRLQPAV